jgi:hypothetical protein
LIENTEVLKLLILNNPKDIKDFLLKNGKKPKAICPIRFINNSVDSNNSKE